MISPVSASKKPSSLVCEVGISSHRIYQGRSLFDIGPIVYANCDHELDVEIEAKLRGAPDVSAAHSAWEFNGRVWWTGEAWREQVWVHGYPVAEYEANDLRALIEHVNAEHGHE